MKSFVTFILLILLTSQIFGKDNTIVEEKVFDTTKVESNANFKLWGANIGYQAFNVGLLSASTFPLGFEFQIEKKGTFPLALYIDLNLLYSTLDYSGGKDEDLETYESSVFSFDGKILTTIKLPSFYRILGVTAGFSLGDVNISSDMLNYDKLENGFFNFVLGPTLETNLATHGIYFKAALLFEFPTMKEYNTLKPFYDVQLGYREKGKKYLLFLGIERYSYSYLFYNEYGNDNSVYSAGFKYFLP